MLKERLKTARKTAGLSQAALAEAVGLAQKTVCLYEKGFKNPSVEVLSRIATELKCSTDYLLGRTDRG